MSTKEPPQTKPTREPAEPSRSSQEAGPSVEAGAGGVFRRLMALQRSAGNQSTARLVARALRGPPEPGEAGADRVASVLSGGSPRPSRWPEAAPPPGERRMSPGGGEPLSPPVRGELEDRLGHPLDHIRIHADGEAARLTSEAHAAAFSAGPHLFFARGEYRPQQAEGRWLLAHEIGHALQAGGGPEPAVHRVAYLIEGTVRPGDRFTLTILAAEGGAVVGTFPITVDASGRIEVSGYRDELRGVHSEALPSRLATGLSNSFRFPVFVRIEWDVLEGQDRRAERAAAARREEALAAFEAYLRVAREPVEAVLRYRQWVTEHRDSPELLTVTPAELWARSLRAPEPARDPLGERREEFLRYMQTLTERTGTLAVEERRRHVESLLRFQRWFEAHRDDARALARNPGEVFGGYSAAVTVEAVGAEVEAERRRRAAAPMSDQEVAARGRKFDEFLSLASELFGFSARRFPYRIPIDSEGRDILVSGDPAVQAALNVIGGQLITWAGQHLSSSDFLSANPRAVLADILRGPSGQILAQAQRAPLEAESIDRGEIIPGRALATFGTAVAQGLVVIAIVGLFVGAEIITAGQATWLLVGVAAGGGVASYLGRREEIERSGYEVPIDETVVASAGDVVGVSQIVEGYTGRRLGTDERLTSVERTDQAATGGAAVALTLMGSRAYRFGQGRGQAWRLRQPGARPPGPGGRTTDPLPSETVPPRPQPSANPGPVEQAARSSLPEESRAGFDRWMEETRRNGGDPERVLARQRPEHIRAQAQRWTERYQGEVEAGQRAEDIRTRMRSDPLDPDVPYTERRGNVTIRSEHAPPPPTDAEIAQAQRLQRAAREQVTLFGDTPAGRSYPGIDGTIGTPPRPLSLKEVSGGPENAGYVRVRAAQAYAAAVEHGYTHVEVHIEIRGSTLEQVRAGWRAPVLAEGRGPVLDGSGTVSRIVITASGGETVTLTPPLGGPGLPAMLTPDRMQPATGEGARERERRREGGSQ